MIYGQVFPARLRSTILARMRIPGQYGTPAKRHWKVVGNAHIMPQPDHRGRAHRQMRTSYELVTLFDDLRPVIHRQVYGARHRHHA